MRSLSRIRLASPRSAAVAVLWGDVTQPLKKLLEPGLHKSNLGLAGVCTYHSLSMKTPRRSFCMAFMLVRDLICLSNHLMGRELPSWSVSFFPFGCLKARVKSLGHLGQTYDFTTCCKWKSLQQRLCSNYLTSGTTQILIRMDKSCKQRPSACLTARQLMWAGKIEWG